jgi:hypothetical protein
LLVYLHFSTEFGGNTFHRNLVDLACPVDKCGTIILKWNSRDVEQGVMD